jgi:hypothetical protein
MNAFVSLASELFVIIRPINRNDNRTHSFANKNIIIGGKKVIRLSNYTRRAENEKRESGSELS